MSSRSTSGRILAVITLILAGLPTLACRSERSRVRVEILGAPSEVSPLTRTDFAARVTGTLQTRVEWSLQTTGNLSPEKAGTIDGDGRYNAPDEIPLDHQNLITVRATSVKDPEQFDEIQFRIVPVPISPSWVHSRGGEIIQIRGAFDASDIPSVTFGDTPAVSVTMISESMLEVVTPAHTIGPADVSLSFSNDRIITYPRALRYAASTIRFGNTDYILPCIRSVADVAVVPVGCGRDELLVACYQEPDAKLLRVGDNDLLEQVESLPLGIDPSSMSVGDLNGDGATDVVVHSSTTSTVFWRETNSATRCTPGKRFTRDDAFSNPGVSWPAYIVDRDGDGADELAHAYQFSTEVTWIIFDGPNREPRFDYTPTTGSVVSLFAADVMNLGTTQMIVADSAGMNIYGSTPLGTLELLARADLPLLNISQARAVDTDGTGPAEIVLTDDNTGTHHIYRWDGDLATLQQTLTFDTPADLWWGRFALRDINGDGFTDLFYSGAATFLHYGPLATSGPAVQFEGLELPDLDGPRVGDLDGDGALDLVLFEYGAAIAIRRSNDASIFTPPHQQLAPVPAGSDTFIDAAAASRTILTLGFSSESALHPLTAFDPFDTTGSGARAVAVNVSQEKLTRLHAAPTDGDPTQRFLAGATSGLVLLSGSDAKSLAVEAHFAVADATLEGIRDEMYCSFEGRAAIAYIIEDQVTKRNALWLWPAPFDKPARRLFDSPNSIDRVHCGDTDRNGTTELIATDRVLGAAHILERITWDDKQAHFESATPLVFPGRINDMLLEDLENDGYPEIVLLDANRTRQILTLHNTPISRWTSMSTAVPGYGVETLGTADLDGDGRKDILGYGAAGVFLILAQYQERASDWVIRLASTGYTSGVATISKPGQALPTLVTATSFPSALRTLSNDSR